MVFVHSTSEWMYRAQYGMNNVTALMYIQTVMHPESGMIIGALVKKVGWLPVILSYSNFMTTRAHYRYNKY